MSAPNVGSKANPSQYDCYNDLAEDEPYFVIRADDPLSDSLVGLRLYRSAMASRSSAVRACLWDTARPQSLV